MIVLSQSHDLFGSIMVLWQSYNRSGSIIVLPQMYIIRAVASSCCRNSMLLPSGGISILALSQTRQRAFAA